MLSTLTVAVYTPGFAQGIRSEVTLQTGSNCGFAPSQTRVGVIQTMCTRIMSIWDPNE